MSRNLQGLESPWPAASRVEGRDVYERAFVRTVLRLRGVEGEPTPLQTAIGRKILKLHDLKVAIENYRLPEMEAGPSGSGQAWDNGVKQAFLLVRFDSVLPPDAQQMQELNEWLELTHAAD